MPSYVVITDSSGAAYGPGPIYRAMRWTATNRLDRAGRCSFEVPAADPRAMELLANKRQAHYYGQRNGVPVEFGALIIDQVETIIEGRSEPMLRVSGDNLLAELATRTVGALELYDTEAHTAQSVAHTYMDGGEYTTADMPAAYDGNLSTEYALDTGLKVDDYLYVRGKTKVSGIWIAFGSGVNSVAATIDAQYFDGSAWISCENINDTTKSGSATFAKDGGIFFTRPWRQVATTHNGSEGFWIRLTPSANLSDGIIIKDMSVEEDIPTGDGLADIMALAPDGWTVDDSGDGYAATEATAYLQFSGETVLEALIALAEHTGEHFRLGPGKSIEWLQDDPETAPVDSGVYAVAGAPGAAGACSILELTESSESYELASRIYPYGAQQGDGRVTLALCTATPPSGYTLAAADNYIKADTAENTYGRIDHVREWPDVGERAGEDTYQAELASNALYQVALEWLQRYSQVQHAYTLRVAHLEREVRPGETMRVTYQKYRNGAAYINIDQALTILGVTLEEDGAGIRTAALELATTDTWPLSGSDFVLREIRAGRRTRAGKADVVTTISQSIVSDNVNIDGGTIDGTAIGANGPASGAFTTLNVSGAATFAGGVAVTGNIGVTGTVDGVDISSHAANASAHHALVTVGNTGLALSGQQLSLSLAEVSGLEVSSGLLLADSVAGAGLSIANKILSVGQGNGLTVAADSVALTTPGTLSVSSTNNAAGSHTHAVTASSNPNGAVSALLKSDAYGGLTLEALQTHGAVTVDQGLTAAASAFRVIHHTHDYAHSHVVINPTAGWALDEQFGLDVDDSLLVRGYIVGKHALQIPGAAMICHYDGPAPFETNFTGNPTGHMGQVATVSGGIIYRPGVFGKAVQVAEATTNLIRNPSAEVDTTYWSFVGDGTSPTRARSSAAAWIGSYGLRWVLGASPNDAAYCYQATGAAPSQGTTYTGQVRVRAVGSAIGKTGQVGIGATGGAQPDQYVFTYPVFTSQWQWVTVSLTVADADRTDLLIRVGYDAGAASGDELHIDAFQIEAKAYATPYCDGSLGPGHSWSGTAHASPSSRTKAVLRYDASQIGIRPDAGAIALWVMPLNASGQWPTLTRMFQWSTGSQPPFTALWSDNAGSTLRAAHADTNITNILGAISWAAGSWHHCCLTWDSTTLFLYVDGALFGSAATTRSAGGDYLFVGQWYDGTRQINGCLDDLLVVNRTLDADEVRAIYESNAPVFAETSTWHWRAGRNLVWADADGLWAVDETGAAMFAVAGTAKSWGGASLGAGDVFVGNVAQNQYLHWDDSAGKLTVYGKIVIQSGSSGIASLSDAGALATKSSVDLATAEVTNKSADNIAEGATRKWAAESGADITGSHTAYDTARVDGTAAATVKGGAVRANAGLDVSGNVARLIRGSDLGAGSGAATGLNLTSTNMGYYNGSSWPVFISSQGYFQFQKDASNYFKWDGTTFEFKGRVVITAGTTVDTLPDGSTYGKVNKTIISGGNIQVGTGTKDSDLNGWAIDSTEIVGQAGDGLDQVTLGTDGKIKAGAGAVAVGRTGIQITLPSSYTQAGTYAFLRSTALAGGLDGYADTGSNTIRLTARSVASCASNCFVYAEAPASYGSTVRLEAYSASGADETLVMAATAVSNEAYTQISSYNPRVKIKGSGTEKFQVFDTSANDRFYVTAAGNVWLYSGLNIGSGVSGAPAGGIKASGIISTTKGIGANLSYTPGDGDICAASYIRGEKGVIVGDGVTAPTAASGVAFIYVDSADGDLKVRFGDGTTKTLATDT